MIIPTDWKNESLSRKDDKMCDRFKKILFIVVFSGFLFAFPECDNPDHDLFPNNSPYWTQAPVDITLRSGENYNELNGTAADNDTPRSVSGDPGYMKCAVVNNTCPFNVDFTGKGGGALGCVMSFTAVTGGTCGVKVAVKDGSGNKVSKTINITVLQNIDIFNCAPDPANEGDSVNCVVQSDIGTPVVDILNDTCGGALNGAGPWTYEFVVSENDAPGNCDASVLLMEEPTSTDSVTIDLNEINVAPSITLTCPASAIENDSINCAINVTDADLPANALTCSIASDDTCGGTLTDCAAYNVATATASCRASVNVTDDGSPALSTVDGADITVNTEEIGIFCPVRVDETAAISCPVVVNVGPSNCAIGPGDTCGGSIDAACAGPYAAPVQGETAGPGECVAEVVKNTLSDSRRIVIDEANQAPTVSPAPASIPLYTGEPFNALYVHATDGDLPTALVDDPGNLTCSNAGDDCSFDVSVTGGGQGSVDCLVDFIAASGAESCTVSVSVTDGYGGSTTVGVPINVDPCIFYVDNTVTGTGGRSWADAFNTIQEAVDTAWYGCDLWVAQGTYAAPGTDPVVIMKEGVSMYGSFVGTETTFAQRYDFFANPTYLDGQNTAHHVVIAAGDAEINGFHIIRGNAAGGGLDDYGGGLFSYYVDNLTIENCIFHDNSAVTRGGGIYQEYSFGSLIFNCLMYDNTAYYGPALYGYVVESDIYNSSFIDNVGTSGGGLYYYYFDLYLANSTIWNCTNCIEQWGDCKKPPDFSSYSQQLYCAVNAYSWVGQGCKVGTASWYGYDPPRPYNFATGPYGNYYAAQPPDQAEVSYYVDSTNVTAASLGLDIYTTSTAGAPDSNNADIGFHYPIPTAP